MLDLTLLAQEIAAIVSEQVLAATAPFAAEKAALLSRIDALEAQRVGEPPLRELVDAAVAALPAPRDGTSVTVEDVAPLIISEVERIAAVLKASEERQSVTAEDVQRLIDAAVAAMPRPTDGKSVTIEDVAPLIAGEVERAFAKLPTPMDGTSVTIADVQPVIDAAVAAIPKPADGKSVTIEDVSPLITREVERLIAALPAPQDGKSVTVEDVQPLIDAAVSAIPKPLDGKSVTTDDVAPLIADEVSRAVAALPKPQDGKSVALETIRAMIDAAVAELPAPQDGKSVTVTDLEPAVARQVEKAVAALPAPIGLAGAMIDRKGALMMTLSDGKLIDLGRVEGKDGDPGLGFDDLAVDQIGERSFVMRFTRGEQVKEFTLTMPVMLDRGVYRAGEAYQKGDCVTYGGSLWIAQRNTDAKPDGADSGWRLGVKRGRDGRGAEAR